MKYTCLSIAGSDCSGGAGVQADLKTFSALGCYGMSVITAVTAQNTKTVKSCYPLPVKTVLEQLESIFEDIPPKAIKIGMLFSADIIEAVSDFLKQHAFDIPIVLDPVMVAKSGDPLLLPTAVKALRSSLIPLAHVLTPNLPEAQILSKNSPSKEEMLLAIFNLGPKAVLLKGGHEKGHIVTDWLYDGKAFTSFNSEKIISKNTHGTGCTLSAAICAFLARGYSLKEACQMAKNYVFEAIEASKNNSVGTGHGPVHHFYIFWKHKGEISERFNERLESNTWNSGCHPSSSL